MFNTARDNDTLGGRIVRAREACGMTEPQFARHVGVKKTTIQAWETDRSEPRANRLTMIAGILGVSPSWLLYGVGESPATETLSDELQLLRQQMERIRELRDQTDLALDNLETSIERLITKQAN